MGAARHWDDHLVKMLPIIPHHPSKGTCNAPINHVCVSLISDTKIWHLIFGQAEVDTIAENELALMLEDCLPCRGTQEHSPCCAAILPVTLGYESA